MLMFDEPTAGMNSAEAPVILNLIRELKKDKNPEAAPPAPEARRDIERHRAETDRLRVLTDFLARPIHAHGGEHPDPDIVTAYNLAVEAALNGIRRAATG